MNAKKHKKIAAFSLQIFFCLCILSSCNLAPGATDTTTVPPSPLVLPSATQPLPTVTQIQPTDTQTPILATPILITNSAPSARSEISFAYDSKTDQVTFFGGVDVPPCWDDCPPFLGDTWFYDVAENTWIEVRPSSSPLPRDNAQLAYDSESDRIILYGGPTSGRNIAPRETWVFDMNTKTWKGMRSRGPADRFGHSMVYDSESDRMIVFGGWNNSRGYAMSDTWAYDYNTDTWTQMNPPVSPMARNFQFMAYDSKADRVIMWGGWGTTIEDKDTSLWVYDYNTDTWEQRNPANGPTLRVFHTMTYDAKSDRIIMYGGYTDAPTGAWDFIKYNSTETWAYDYNQDTWTLLNPGVNPGKLSSAGMVYLPSIDRTVLFGGRFDFEKFNDKTWLYDYATNTWTDVTSKP